MLKLFEVLDLPTDIDAVTAMPRDGFSKDIMSCEKKSYKRAHHIIKIVVNRMCKLLSSSSVESWYKEGKENEGDILIQSQLDSVNSNVSKMILCGHMNTRIVAESILCKPHDNINVKEIMDTQAHHFCGQHNYFEKKSIAMISLDVHVIHI